jgi:hypothetical protein
MPEQGNPILSPDTQHDAEGPQDTSGSERHIRALAQKFSKSQMIEQDGGLLIKGVPMLAAGTWTDSAVGTPLNYPEGTLREYAANWLDNTGWSRHLGGTPRDVTDKVAELREPRYENGAVMGDIFVHGATQKSRDLMEMVKRKLISYVSVEHNGNERYNPATRQMEASSISFLGFAFVNKGACKLCRINEEVPAKAPAPMPEVEIMDTKELEAQIASLTKELEAVKAKPEVKFEVPKELSDKIAGMEAHIKELEKQPAPVVAAPVTEHRELGTVETVVVIDKVNKTVRGV